MEAHLKHERARADALAWEAERAQLLAIRSHRDPHFLFTTLNATRRVVSGGWAHCGTGAPAALWNAALRFRGRAGSHLASGPRARAHPRAVRVAPAARPRTLRDGVADFGEAQLAEDFRLKREVGALVVGKLAVENGPGNFRGERHLQLEAKSQGAPQPFESPRASVPSQQGASEPPLPSVRGCARDDSPL